MKSICIPVSALLNKVLEMTDENMVDVKLTLVDQMEDRGVNYPAFLHFEAYTEDGTVYDYECIDLSCHRC